MKRIFSILLPAILAIMCACGEKTVENPGPALSVSTASISAVALGEQVVISVTSGTDWLVRSSANWIKLMTASGKGSDQPTRLTIQIEENRTTSERTAILTFVNLGKETVEIGVTQAAGSGGGGGGTTDRGINNAQDLVAFAKAVNGEGSIAQYMVDGVVKINRDIDCSSITEWVPAGTSEMPLIYSIDGNNKTLSNINWKIDVNGSEHLGFIGYAKNITIEKLNFGSDGSKIEFTGDKTGKIRAGAILGYGKGVHIEKVTNNTDLKVTGSTGTGNNLILGGIAGYVDSDSSLGGDLVAKGCINNGDITVSVVGQEGGLVGYNSGKITNCSNYGTITGPSDGTTYGPGWLCSYNNTKANVTSNFGHGFVGTTPAMMYNSMMNYESGYDLEANTVDWTLDAYYDWEEVATKQLHAGATYHHYSCTNVPRHIHVVEIDLTNPGIEITQAFAGEMVPNPNGNGNNNNGFKLRERLSDVCSRRRSEGQKILAGVNSCFFDSNDGFPRGHIVEEGEPIFINNPSVATGLTNHVWGFTVFTDRTASCGVKKFSGKIKAGGKEYTYSSVNDTILRHASPNYQANLFTSRYVRQPYTSTPSIINDLAKDVLYIVCEYTGDNMMVNTGYAPATVVEIRDGRTTPLSASSLPYQTSKKRVVISMSGDMASEWSTFIQTGATVEFKCDISIDSDASKPIYTLNSSMYLLMNNGQDASDSPGSSASLYTKYDPKTFPVVSLDRTKVWLVEVDGRQVDSGWYSLGVKGYEMYRIAKKLGGGWVTGFDGGGSSAIWIYDASSGSGALVNRPSDSKGERSDMNYILLREK